MILGTQYFRPPFPNDRYWDDDFKRIRESGLNTVQLWVLWSWVEATPGTYRWDDYDRLMELAQKHGLQVVLSAIGEVQPYWIHREVPDSEMINRLGHRVVSSNRNEIHHGMTPGGCFDHPEVWKRMCDFMSSVVVRYRGESTIAGWDCWNELRWNVQADDLVCYCDHTLARYRAWLDKKYGGLDGLNRAWIRRHSAWDEVRPGKVQARPYTDMMAFQHFLTERSNEHGIARYRLIKDLDPSRPVTLHAGEPCTYFSGNKDWGTWAIDRGNDWAFADHIDGVGTSSFPAWGFQDDTSYALRLEYTRSAASGKDVWLSELQGGRASSGFDIHRPVTGRMQQRWVWNGAAIGAESIIFWCWRDEVFGQESGGFGIVGDDGFAKDRVAALQKTGAVLAQYKELLADYTPAPASAGFLFSPQSYYLHYAQEGHAERARNALMGYGRALLNNNIGFEVVEEEHLAALKGLRVLFMPRTAVVDTATEAALETWVRGGGTLVCESECGAFDSRGLYRYPAERFTARLTGMVEAGRRQLTTDHMDVDCGAQPLRLRIAQWTTPRVGAGADVLARSDEGALVSVSKVGEGQIVLVNTFVGEFADDLAYRDFDRFVAWTCGIAGWKAPMEVSCADGSGAWVKHGALRDTRAVVFVRADGTGRTVRLRINDTSLLRAPVMRDIISGKTFALASDGAALAGEIDTGEWGVAMLVEER